MSSDGVQTVSFPYLRNMLGFGVDEESMEVVPHAQLELYVHVCTKFSQLFGVIGGTVGAGLGAARGKVTPGKGFMNGSRNGMLIGIPVGILATYGRMRGIKKGGVDDMDYQYFDRSYRLRHNRNQVRVDRAAYAGMGVGVVAGIASGTSLSVLHTSAAGLVAGTLIGGAYNLAFSSK